jgi:hypothetical protein
LREAEGAGVALYAVFKLADTTSLYNIDCLSIYRELLSIFASAVILVSSSADLVFTFTASYRSNVAEAVVHPWTASAIVTLQNCQLVQSKSSFTQPSCLQRVQHCDNGSDIYQQATHVRRLFPYPDCRSGPYPTYLDSRLYLP